MSNFQTVNAEILELFAPTGRELPSENSDMGKAVSILQEICDSHSHSIPEMRSSENDEDADEIDEENENNACALFEALETIEENIGTDDFTLDFDGNEYRIISESAIWGIYVEIIKEITEDCYELNLDKLPSFLAVTIDWEQTAKNCYVDGYGHTFSGYDGSEYEAAGYYIFRTN